MSPRREGRHGRRRADDGRTAERWYMVLAVLGSGFALTGVQSILPALPSIGEALGLSEGELSLVMSLYLLPGVVLAVPAGLLADRFGRRVVYCVSLAVFGLAGLAQLAVRSFAMLLIARVLQGACFAAVLPLSITMIGDLRSGYRGVKVQSYRTVAMATFDAGLPVVGGFLAAVAWYAPFALQLTALPLALLGWFLITPELSRPARQAGVLVKFVPKALTRRDLVPLHIAGFCRFFFKFGVFAYYPLLAVRQHGMSEVDVGVALGAAALAGALGAGAAGPLTRVLGPRAWMLWSLAAVAASLFAVTAVRSPLASFAVIVLFGLGDGVFGVFLNFYLADQGDAATRATIVAMNGTMRNLGKFVAPVVMGALVALLNVPLGFVALAGLAVLAIVPVGRLPRGITSRLPSRADADAATPSAPPGGGGRDAGDQPRWG